MEKYIKEKEALLENVDKSIISKSSLERALLTFREGESFKKTFTKPEYKLILDTISALVTLQIDNKVVDTKLSSNIARKRKSTGINGAGKQSSCNYSLESAPVETYDNLLEPLQNPERVQDLKAKKLLAQNLKKQLLAEEAAKYERELKDAQIKEEKRLAQQEKIRLEKQKVEAENLANKEKESTLKQIEINLSNIFIPYQTLTNPLPVLNIRKEENIVDRLQLIFKELFPKADDFFKYYNIILNQEIDYSSFLYLDKVDLIEMGITLIGPQIKILEKIEKIKQESM